LLTILVLELEKLLVLLETVLVPKLLSAMLGNPSKALSDKLLRSSLTSVGLWTSTCCH
jgi:hypothetical protein